MSSSVMVRRQGGRAAGTAGADGPSGMMAVDAAVVVVIIDGEEEGSHSDSAARETASRRFLRWRDAAIPVDGKEEEDEEDEEEEDEEEDEEEEFPHLPPTHTTRPGIHGVSLSNASGNMFNSNVGNVAKTVISNVGNNNSRNYYG